MKHLKGFYNYMGSFILLLGFLALSSYSAYAVGNNVGFAEPKDPIILNATQKARWKQSDSRLHASWTNPDLRHSRSILPVQDPDKITLTVWRGERASAEFLIWTKSGAKDVECKVSRFVSGKEKLPEGAVETRFVRYTLSDSTFTLKGKAILSDDMLDPLGSMDIDAMTVRPVWVTVEVPRDAKPGKYIGSVTVSAKGEKSVKLPLEIKVLNHTLTEPTAWKFHLDLWQHPAAVARAQGLELWSDSHFEALEEIMGMLAQSGQKVITATLNKDPWNHQCYDGYEPMILWTLDKNGNWRYDYTVFDRWVSMMMGLGINKMINCYSMVPWNCELEYFDEAKGKKVTVKAEPGTDAFVEMWTPFIKDFVKHQREKGWLEITNIAMDERSPASMDAAARLLAECAPEMGFAIADNHKSYKKYTMMNDVCVAQGQPTEHSDILERRAKGLNTTFYVCCNPLFPNTFTYSEPFEAELLGWYGIAYDYDGMLRWAYNSWPESPETDSRYGNWCSGDTYLVYPYSKSSVRFEKLRDGIENAEKIRILKSKGVDVSKLMDEINSIKAMNVNDPSLPWLEKTEKLRKALDELSIITD